MNACLIEELSVKIFSLNTNFFINHLLVLAYGLFAGVNLFSSFSHHHPKKKIIKNYFHKYFMATEG